MKSKAQRRSALPTIPATCQPSKSLFKSHNSAHISYIFFHDILFFKYTVIINKQQNPNTCSLGSELFSIYFEDRLYLDHYLQKSIESLTDSVWMG